MYASARFLLTHALDPLQVPTTTSARNPQLYLRSSINHLPACSSTPLHTITHRGKFKKSEMVFLDSGRRDCIRKMKHGAVLGAGVGGAAGLIFGSYEAAQIRGIPFSQVCCICFQLFSFLIFNK